jgi:hypothetical protein
MAPWYRDGSRGTAALLGQLLVLVEDRRRRWRELLGGRWWSRRRREPRADISAGGGDLVELVEEAQRGDVVRDLAQDREPTGTEDPGDDEDAPYEVVGRFLQGRAVAVRQ